MGEFAGWRTPATWRGRITGRNTIWDLHFSASGLINDVDQLVRLYDAFKTTMRELEYAGEAESGSPD
jgi:hypothetical protein